ncbi:MAG TPA: hypothetical protein VNB49_10720 [Candidatus Dormibacteraeota bacterium]|nr:hypothetical protein [Candidatus Dormibacteraeota bacterium]
MKGNVLKVLIVVLGLTAFLTVGVEYAAAQGPAGVGASTAAKETSHTSHSLNPIKWVKKDKNSADANGSRSDVEKKLTPKLQAAGLLPANSNLTEACSPFTALNECLAALHASHNLGLSFACLGASVTGVHTNTDVSGCKAADSEKALPLNKAIHALNPDVDAKGATKKAEQQAKEDLQNLGS